MTSPAPFKQVDVTRALKGAVAAGVEVGRVEIEPDGKIVVWIKDDAVQGGSDSIDKMLGIK